jgi:hypothetical protein
VDRRPVEDAPLSSRRWGVRLLFRTGYWVAVLVVSIAILVALILFLESRDNSSLNGMAAPAGALRA